MRKLLCIAFLFSPVFASSQQDTVDMDLLETDSTSVYRYNGKPFTGTAMRYFDNGQPLRARTYEHGIQVSVTQWFQSGQMKSFVKYKTSEIKLCKSEKNSGFFCKLFGDCREKRTISQAIVTKRWDGQGKRWMNERTRLRKRCCYNDWLNRRRILPFSI